MVIKSCIVLYKQKEVYLCTDSPHGDGQFEMILFPLAVRETALYSTNLFAVFTNGIQPSIFKDFSSHN